MAGAWDYANKKEFNGSAKPTFEPITTTLNITEQNSGSLLLTSNQSITIQYDVGDSAIIDLTSTGDYTLTINGIDIEIEEGRTTVGLIAVGDGSLQIYPKKIQHTYSPSAGYVTSSSSTVVEGAALNTLLKALKSNSITPDAIWPLTGDSTANKLFNLLDTATRKLSVYAGALVSSTKGVRLQDVLHLDTTFMPHASHIPTWPDAGITFYLSDYTTSGVALVIRSTEANAWQMYPNDGGNTFVSISSGGQYVTLSTTPRRGLWTIQRYQNQISVFLDGVKIGSVAASGSVSSTTAPIRLINQASGQYQELSFISIHPGMSDSNTVAFHTAVNNFITSLNKQA